MPLLANTGHWHRTHAKIKSFLSIPFISVFFAIVDGRLVALERGFVNPLQALAFVLWNARSSHYSFYFTNQIKSGRKVTKNGDYFVTLPPIINKIWLNENI